MSKKKEERGEPVEFWYFLWADYADCNINIQHIYTSCTYSSFEECYDAWKKEWNRIGYPMKGYDYGMD